MLHEVLLALLGYTGSVIIKVTASLGDLDLEDIDELADRTVDHQVKFMVNPHLTFISVAEVE